MICLSSSKCNIAGLFWPGHIIPPVAGPLTIVYKGFLRDTLFLLLTPVFYFTRLIFDKQGNVSNLLAHHCFSTAAQTDSKKTGLDPLTLFLVEQALKTPPHELHFRKRQLCKRTYCKNLSAGMHFEPAISTTKNIRYLWPEGSSVQVLSCLQDHLAVLLHSPVYFPALWRSIGNSVLFKTLHNGFDDI